MHTTIDTRLEHPADTSWDHLTHIGWGLLLMLTGTVWLLLPEAAPPGSWLFVVAIILAGVNAVRYARHIGVSRFTVAFALCALAAAIAHMWWTDSPMAAMFVIAIGASLMVRPLFSQGDISAGSTN